MSLAELAKWFASKSPTQVVDTPYSKVVAVYACVKRKAQTLAMMPLRVSTADDQVVENGPLVELLERPAAGLTLRLAVMAISAFLDLFGKVYIVKQIAGGRIIGWRPVSPLEIAEQRGVNGVIGYTYAPIGRVGAAQELTIEQVHVITDPDYGTGDLEHALSPRHAAGLAISQHYQADVANDQSLRHGAGGGLGLKTERNLTEPQRDELESTLEDRFSGPSNRHRWMLLEGGLTVEKLFSTFAEMEFTELKYYSREDICVAFGMSSQAAGYTGREAMGSGLSTEKADEIAWTSTHLPRAEWIAAELMLAILPAFAGDASLSLRDAARREMARRERVQRHRYECKAKAGVHGYQYYFWFDASSISVVQRATLELAKQAAQWVSLGVPLNGVIRAFDLPFDEPEWGDTWFKPMGLVDVREDSMPWSDDPTGGEPADPAPGDQEGQRGGGTGRQAGKGAKPADRRQRAGVEVRQPSDESLARIWGAWRTSWAGLERSCRSKVRAHFYELRQGVLDRLAKLPAEGLRSIEPERRRDIIATILFDLQEANGLLVAKVRPLFRESYRLGGEQAMQEAAEARGGKSDPFNISDPGTLAKLREREVKITETNVTLRRQIAKTLADGMQAGESMAQLTDRVKDTFNFASNRARVIARTEIGAAVEEARHEGRRQAGVPMKSWLWSRKETGRPGHMETEFQTMQAPLPNDQEFTLAQTGNRCQHPRGTGEAEDDINCACTTLGRFPGDSIKSVIDRYRSRGFLTYEQLAARDAKPAGSEEPPK
jgi:HK97 family phage portal protein